MRNGPLDTWILKRILIPGLTTVFVFAAAHFGCNQINCRREAASRGYLEGSYIHRGRYPQVGVCVCRGLKTADGSVDATAVLEIGLD